MNGYKLASTFALLVLALLPVVFGASLSCSITTPGSCSGTIVMYLENETGGSSNAHAQNVSVATYSNVVCCTPTGDTLSLSCSDQIFGVLSDTDNAHFEQNDQGNYNTDQCLTATTEHIVCGYEPGCASYDTCLFSYASSDGANVTNSHVGACADYYLDVCCTLNDRPVLPSATLNATSTLNLSQDNLTLWLGSVTDAESDTTTAIADWRNDGVSIAVLNLPLETNTSYSSPIYVKDYSSYAKSLLIGGNPSFTSDCVVGNCYLFNDASNDYFFIGGDSELQDRTSFTVAVWMRPNGIPTKEQAGLAGLANTGNTNDWMFGFFNYGADFGFMVHDGAAWRTAYNDTGVVSGQWIHAVAVYDGSLGSNQVRLYLNGTLSATATASSIRSFSGVENLHIGEFQHSTNNKFFNGTLDEFYFFSDALSAEQIQLLYQAGVQGKSFDVLSSQETTGGDNWTVVVTPNDGYQDGTSITTNAVYIAAGEVLITTQPTFVNWTTAHSFNVTAGASYASGASGITATSINVTSGSCSELATNLNGIYYNVTYNCTGVPYVSASINITFCDAGNNCNTTNTVSNAYPNQAPTMNNLLLPTDGNESLIDRNVNFSWQAANDAEGDSINYTINVTNTVCQDRSATDITATNYIFGPEFNTSFECSNTNYYWQVQACDDWDCSSWTGQFNFSIQDYLDITVLNNEINFSSVALLDGDNTSDNSPSPFLFENSGNIKADLIGITSTGLWDSVSLNTTYYQSAVGNATEPNSFNWAASSVDWLNITSAGWVATLIAALDYNDSKDTAEIDIHVQVPSAEPPGAKTDTLTFIWQSS